MAKWKIDGQDIERNPNTFVPRHRKDVSYKESVIGREIRVVPYVEAVESYYEATWNLAPESLRNFLHDLYVRDESFTLKSHLTTNPREAWQVKIDEFSAEYARQGSGTAQRFNISALFRVIGKINDPILTNTYSAYPYPFIVDNITNRNVHDAAIFIRGIVKDVVNPVIKMTFLNLLSNPGFEQVDSSGTVSVWEDANEAWESDVVLFYEGNRCVKTFSLNQPLRQEFVCAPNENITVGWSAMADVEGSNKVRLTLKYYEESGAQIGSYQDTRSVTTQWQDFWFTTTVPANTTNAAVEFEKIDGTEDTSDYVYIDRTLVRLGTSSTAPDFTDEEHIEMKYNGTIHNGSTLKIDLLSETAMIDDQDVSSNIEGQFFYLPIGKSIILFSEDGGSSGQTEAIVRYNEAYR